MTGPDAVLDFWLGPADGPERGRPRDLWFTRSEETDAAIRDRFADATERAREGGLDSWCGVANACLALVILLDQFPRNLHRGRAAAFAADRRARAVARHALATGVDREADPVARCFFYLPFEHSESLADQRLSVRLCDRVGGDPEWRAQYRFYAEAHLDVIRRFGRFPHRNAALGRASTEAELAYLAEPGAGF